jgi:hypothetical protein
MKKIPIFCLHCGCDFEITVNKGKITYPKKCPGCGFLQLLNDDQKELARDLEKILTKKGITL